MGPTANETEDLVEAIRHVMKNWNGSRRSSALKTNAAYISAGLVLYPMAVIALMTALVGIPLLPLFMNTVYRER
jgi:hypothetical protein